MATIFTAAQKETPGTSKGSHGFSLVEVLISLGIVGITLAYVAQTVTDILREKAQSRAIFNIFESDKLLRFEIGGFLSSLQRRITEAAIAEQCVSPFINTIFNQLVVEKSLNETIVFGLPSQVRGISPFTTRVVDAASAVVLAAQSPGAAQINPNAPELVSLWQRCGNQQTIKNGANFQRQSVVYLCAYGDGFIAEVKASFWDFNFGRPLNCGAMNQFPGRGIYATYRSYHYAPAKMLSAFPYSVKKNFGSLSSTKYIDGEGFPYNN